MNFYLDILGFEPDEELLFHLNAYSLTAIKILQLKAKPDFLIVPEMDESQRVLAESANNQKQMGITNLEAVKSHIESEILKKL